MKKGTALLLFLLLTQSFVMHKETTSTKVRLVTFLQKKTLKTGNGFAMHISECLFTGVFRVCWGKKLDGH